ncbi:hypothetical protein WH7805_09709 [Synechococcus sp. WH 7805]|nr:hypothetical protein WH7805_09709 [Synechococcus sp. WH 7805]
MNEASMVLIKRFVVDVTVLS